MAYGLMK